jgi:hypothetical protein
MEELSYYACHILQTSPHATFFLFAQLKKILHSCHFKNAEDITATTLDRKRCISAQLL